MLDQFDHSLIGQIEEISSYDRTDLVDGLGRFSLLNRTFDGSYPRSVIVTEWTVEEPPSP